MSVAAALGLMPLCGRSHTFVRAIQELDELLGDWRSLSKAVQAAVLSDVQHAIAASTRCSAQQEALSDLLKTCKQVPG